MKQLPILHLNLSHDKPDGWYIAGEEMTTYRRGARIDIGEQVCLWNGWLCEDEEDARKLRMMLELGQI